MTRRSLAFFLCGCLLSLAVLQEEPVCLYSSEILLPDLFQEGADVFDAKDLFYFSSLWMNRNLNVGSGDFDGDGLVNLNDLLPLIDEYRYKRTPTPSAIEEPTPTPTVSSTPEIESSPTSLSSGDETKTPTPLDDATATPTQSVEATSTPLSGGENSPTPISTALADSTPVPSPTSSQPEFVRLWSLHPSISLFSDPVVLPSPDGYAASKLGYAAAAQTSEGKKVFVSFDRYGRIFNRSLPISTADYSSVSLSDGGDRFGNFFESPKETRRFRFESFDLESTLGATISVEHLGADSIAWAFCGSERGFAMAALRYPNAIAVHRISAEGQYLGVVEHTVGSNLPTQPAVMTAAIGADRIAVVYSDKMDASGSASPLTAWIFSLDGELLTPSPIAFNDEPYLDRLVGDSNGTFYLITKSIYGLRLNRFSPKGVILNKILSMTAIVDVQYQDDLLWLLDGERHAMFGLNEMGVTVNGPVSLYPPGWTKTPKWLRLKKSGADLGVFFSESSSRNQIYYMQVEAGVLATPTPLPASGVPSGETETIQLAEGIDILMTKINRGTFQQGSPDTEQGRRTNEGPQHTVTLTYDFFMSVTEITNKQYKVYDSTHKSPTFAGLNLGADDQPVVGVSWEDANDFCQWLSDRSDFNVSLPTEAEWEYVARAGTTARRPWGADLLDREICSHANVADVRAASAYAAIVDFVDCDDGFAGAAPVASFSPNAFGVYDMLGNVREWCQDWFAKYTANAQTDPTGPQNGSSRVIRGGSWYHNPDFCRCAYRSGDPPDNEDFHLGFRIVIREE